jgi:hypothetical protein
MSLTKDAEDNRGIFRKKIKVIYHPPKAARLARQRYHETVAMMQLAPLR